MASIYKSISGKGQNGSKARAAAEHGDDEVSLQNRQRVLILSSRGVTYRHRHLLADLHSLLPHSRKDAKLDTKSKLSQLNELADLYNCNNILFFEARKAQDLYIWLSKPPNGPTAKFHCQNLHTMEELHFTGNCLRGSRPVLSFDAGFDAHPHTRVLRELLTQTFGVPPRSRKSKPFIDHVMGFTLAGGKIWVRCYQIVEKAATKPGAKSDTPASESEAVAALPSSSSIDGNTSLTLLEIGPRFVLTPIVILEGSFGGPVIYENKEFVSPNAIRGLARAKRGSKYNQRADGVRDRRAKHTDLGLRTEEGQVRDRDDLDERDLFA